jgi:agmatine/peptidylarginine deiminase
VALFLLAAASSRPQSAPPAPDAPPHAANDVVMLSLEPLNPRAEHGRHVRAGLLGNADPERNAEKHLLEIQMNIVRETAPFGPVLLLAPDEATKNAVFQRCQEFQLCPLFRSDRVRVKVVPHDGVWIRDFGPQIDVSGDSASVVHWRYFDIRKEEAKQEKLQELETARLKLLETRQQEDQPDDFSQESTPDAHKTIVSAIDAKIYLLREYSQILSEASPQRFNDENSAFDIADAVLAAPDFIYKSSNVAVDGGNLLKLEDGRCLTTRVLLSRNKDQNINLDQELENIGGCQAVTYLDPLPGPVIEHVDMFALPIGGKRILLASYDLTKPFATEYWSALSDAERDLALNAGLAMELDAERLRALGYEVIPVPSPFPRIPANGHIYYPTVLNALVRASADGYQQLLLPAYQEYETDLQAAARKQIAEAFGPRTTLVPIEATEAAKSQGAIHCLTLTAPLRLSIFSDSADVSRRAAYLARKEQLDRTLAADIASQIPATGLQGSWAILEEDERAEQTPLGLYPQKIFFGKTEFQKGVFDHLESRGTYVIDKRDLTSWSLQLLFPDQDLTRATVEWLSKDEVQLRLEDADTAIVLKRVAADLASPFKTEEPAAASAADAARKHPRRKTPKPAN